MTKTIITAGIVALIVAVGLWLILPAKAPIATASFGNTSTDGSQSNLPTPTNYDYLVARLGLGLGTNLSVSSTGAGNINILGQKMNLVGATTTPCNIQSPFTTATSTAELIMNITTATSTSQNIQIATASVPNAFTTIVSSGVTVTGGTQATLGVDTIASSTGQLITVGPSGWIAAGSSNSTALTYGGTCSVIFTSAN